MTSFDDRERAFENKFAHDAELRFKAEMRRNKLLGLWAAELMGMAADEAQAYAKEVIRSDLAEVGDEDVFRKLRGDFDKFGVDITDHRIRKAMEEKLDEAQRQIMSEKK